MRTFHYAVTIACFTVAAQSGCGQGRKRPQGQELLGRWIEALQTGDDTRRTRAAWMIPTLEASDFRPAVRPLITALLKDKCAEVRSAAAGSLATIGGDRALKPLLTALKDKEAIVRAAAARAVVKARCPPKLHGEVAKALLSALGDLGPRVRQASLESLAASWHRSGLETELYRQGQKYLSDPAPGVRVAAAALLGKLPGYAHIPSLVGALKDEAPAVRAAAATALGNLGAVPHPGRPFDPGPLIAALKDADARVRMAAVVALGRIGDPRAVEPVVIVLTSDRDVFIRAAAASALGGIEDKGTILPLIAALDDPTPAVSEAALSALVKKRGQCVPQLILTLKQSKPVHATGVVKALSALGAGPVCKPLAELLSDGDLDVRASVARALGYVGGGAAAELLVPLLEDGLAQVRKAAAQALGSVGSKESAPALIAALKDEEATVRAAAAEALGYLWPKEAPTAVVREQPAKPSAVDPLILALEDPSSDVRQAATGSLRILARHVPLRPLADLLKDPGWEVRAAAAAVLTRVPSYHATDHLKTALRDTDWRVRLSAARGTRHHLRPHLFPVMKDVHEHEEVRLAAAEALTPTDQELRASWQVWREHHLRHFQEVWRDSQNPRRIRAAAWRAIQRIGAAGPWPARGKSEG